MSLSLIACFLVATAHAFAPTPIRWGGSPTEKFALVPKAFLNAALVPQELTISDHAGAFLDTIPRFTANLDNTITWDARGWCLEANGDKSGNVVRVNHCTGGSAQKWTWLPKGRGRGMMQLMGTSKCLDVSAKQNSLHGGASVQLRECDDRATESWEFGETDSFPYQGEASSSSMRRVALSLISMAALAALSLGTWLVQSRAKARLAAASHSSQHHGVCMTTPLTGQEMIPAVMAVRTQNKQSGVEKMQGERKALEVAREQTLDNLNKAQTRQQRDSLEELLINQTRKISEIDVKIIQTLTGSSRGAGMAARPPAPAPAKAARAPAPAKAARAPAPAKSVRAPAAAPAKSVPAPAAAPAKPARAPAPPRGEASTAALDSPDLGQLGPVAGLVAAGVLARGVSMSSVKAREAEQAKREAEEAAKRPNNGVIVGGINAGVLVVTAALGIDFSQPIF